MLRGMTIRQLQEWRAYADLEPFDEERDDLRAASIVQAIYNVHRRKNSPQIPLKDCVLRFGEAPQPGQAQRTPAQAVEQIKAVMRDLMATHNKPERGERVRRP